MLKNCDKWGQIENGGKWWKLVKNSDKQIVKNGEKMMNMMKRMTKGANW